MYDPDLVSVIIPTYNGVAAVANAVDSVLEQDYENIEIIVVDDNGKGSLEQLKTEEVLKQYSNKHNIVYIVHEVNKNGAAARNTGFSSSRGAYITLLDDDDVYYPSKVRKEVEAFKELDNKWGLVYCTVEKYINGKFRAVNKAHKSGDLLQKLLLHQVVIGSDSLMVRREVFEKVNGFDESFKRHQDFEFTARISAKYKIKAISTPGVRYNVTRRNNPKSHDIAIKYRKHYVEKMLPYIEQFGETKQKFIIYYNMIDFVGHSVKRGRILKAYYEFKKITTPWIKEHKLWMFIYVIIVKFLFKVKSVFGNISHYIKIIKKRNI